MGELSGLGQVAQSPIVIVLVTIAVLAAFLSKKAAEVAGPLGAAGRWWSQRQVRRVQRDRELEAEKRGGRDDLVSGLRRELADQTARIDELVEQRHQDLRDHAAELAIYYDHIVAWTRWAQAARVQAASGGIDLPDPPRFPTSRPTAPAAEECL